MKKLELKHLAPYLPYGLKITLEGDEYEHELVGLIDTIDGVKLISAFDDYGSATFDDVKPILRPLTDLTKEIEHNSEKLVPLDNIKLLYNEESFSKNGSGQIMMYIDGDWEFTNNWPYELMTTLFEWHFDVLGLIDVGLAIDKNKL